MAFVQLIDMEIDSGRYPEAMALEEEWRARTMGERTTVRNTWCRHHTDRDRYIDIVEFESYADAVRNSELPATQEFSQRLQGIARSVRYIDLDVEQVNEG
ncbi:MAG TPA: hypothetical protein VIR27_07950 [Mycobacteriales bacterium]|jgi:hypothetical protein